MKPLAAVIEALAILALAVGAVLTYLATQTLLERWSRDDWMMHITYEEIRRALAVAQAVEEAGKDRWPNLVGRIMRRADELLEGRK